jgi:hypothetical protein
MRTVFLIRRLRDLARKVVATLAHKTVGIAGLIAAIQAEPTDIRKWVVLIDHEARADRLPPQSARLAAAHDLTPSAYVVNWFSDRIGEKADMREMAVDPLRNLAAAVEEIVRWKTIFWCEDAHKEGGYYSAAEPAMDTQWTNVIWPIIKESDFSHCLELACGHGRNTERLRRHAAEIHLVDVNQNCLDVCRSRFGDEKQGC